MSEPGARRPVLVSACLLGARCRYDGRAAEAPELREALAGRPVLALCPEELGGLGTPRPRASLVGGDGDRVLDGQAQVVTEAGRDVSDSFRLGAERAVAMAAAAGVEEAILKQRSPSCGSAAVHRDGALAPGRGVTAAALIRAGVRVRGAG